MTQAEQQHLNILDTSSAVTHLHILHYGVTILAFISIFGALYYISKNRNRRAQYKVKLIQKHNITHDTIIFTFLLPKNRKTLGLKVGEHIQIETLIGGEMVNRKYTPISRVDRKETFQLLIKVYNKCERFPQGGKLTQYLDTLNINDQIDISLPYGRFNYQKHGQIRISTLQKKTLKKKYNNFYMVAGGTGITPLYQIIQYITENELAESPNLTLLFANRSEDDILLENELKEFAKMNPKLKLYFSVDKSIKPNWNGFEGFIDEQKVSKSMGDFANDIQNTVFLTCGPPILGSIVEKIWRTKYNVKPQNMFRF